MYGGTVLDWFTQRAWQIRPVNITFLVSTQACILKHSLRHTRSAHIRSEIHFVFVFRLPLASFFQFSIFVLSLLTVLFSGLFPCYLFYSFSFQTFYPQRQLMSQRSIISSLGININRHLWGKSICLFMGKKCLHVHISLYTCLLQKLTIIYIFSWAFKIFPFSNVPKIWFHSL